MEKTQYRQGDVLIVRRRRIAASELTPRSRENGRVVLAHGEATGHAHAISSHHADLFEAAGRTYLAVDGDVVALEHEEHGTIEIDPGFYEVIRQREYSPEAVRNVMD